MLKDSTVDNIERFSNMGSSLVLKRDLQKFSNIMRTPFVVSTSLIYSNNPKKDTEELQSKKP